MSRTWITLILRPSLPKTNTSPIRSSSLSTLFRNLAKLSPHRSIPKTPQKEGRPKEEHQKKKN